MVSRKQQKEETRQKLLDAASAETDEARKVGAGEVDPSRRGRFVVRDRVGERRLQHAVGTDSEFDGVANRVRLHGWQQHADGDDRRQRALAVGTGTVGKQERLLAG